MTDREKRVLEDVLRFNIKVIHIPQGSNLLADYLSRINHNSREAPEYPRHAGGAPVVAVVHEGAVIDIKLMPLIEAANNDNNYQATIQALQDGDSPGHLHPNHPAQRHRRVWKHLSVYRGPTGHLILYKKGRVLIPDAAVDSTLETLHKDHATISEMTESAAMNVWWRSLEQDIRDKVRACLTCEENQRMRYSEEPMDMHPITNLKPGDRLVIDWASVNQHRVHVAVDAATGFMWKHEYPQMSTTYALKHIDSITTTMGRFGEVLSNNGPSYKETFNEEIRARGMDPIKGATYHPSTQGAAERAVGIIKTRIAKVGFSQGKQFQDMIWTLNTAGSSRGGTGSPAVRLLGRSIRGPLPSPPNSLAPAQVEQMKARLDRLRAKSLKRANARSVTFQPGDPVKVWDHRDRRYSIEATVDSPIIGDDLVPRSYKVVTSDGRMRHVTAAWLVPAAATIE